MPGLSVVAVIPLGRADQPGLGTPGLAALQVPLALREQALDGQARAPGKCPARPVRVGGLFLLRLPPPRPSAPPFHSWELGGLWSSPPGTHTVVFTWAPESLPCSTDPAADKRTTGSSSELARVPRVASEPVWDYGTSPRPLGALSRSGAPQSMVSRGWPVPQQPLTGPSSSGILWAGPV